MTAVGSVPTVVERVLAPKAWPGALRPRRHGDNVEWHRAYAATAAFPLGMNLPARSNGSASPGQRPATPVALECLLLLVRPRPMGLVTALDDKPLASWGRPRSGPHKTLMRRPTYYLAQRPRDAARWPPPLAARSEASHTSGAILPQGLRRPFPTVNSWWPPHQVQAIDR